MALKDTWIDLADAIEGVPNSGDDASAETINKIAHAVIELEEHPVEFTETDPTVPSWAKQPNKPTYTAYEVGACDKKYVDEVVATKADKVNTYTKEEVLNMHSNLVHNDTYERDMNKKADKADTYTKTEVDNLINSAIGEALEGEY